MGFEEGRVSMVIQDYRGEHLHCGCGACSGTELHILLIIHIQVMSSNRKAMRRRMRRIAFVIVESMKTFSAAIEFHMAKEQKRRM